MELALTDAISESGATVLVIDDNSDNLELMEALLLGEGFRSIVLARDGREGLQILEKNHQIGVVLLDLMLPEMDGYEICKRISCGAKTHHIPVIVVTGAAFRHNEAVQKSFAAGAIDFISKPINEVDLLSRVRVALALYEERCEHRSSLQRIADKEARFRTILDRLPVGIALVDGQGQILLINGCLRDQLYLKTKKPTANILNYLVAVDSAQLEKLLDQAYQDNKSSLATRLRTPDAVVPVNLSATLYGHNEMDDSTFILTLEGVFG